ncbi:alanyl-tRNA editing protein Aarsd1-B-like isoform X2 [Homarus americanus]|uniref:alanyl-tRNA editing protein Aarsd1-B-like isoform X2 n=1 Tax=Homarus americanus TaxID=6706 RepID=UPI001C43789F|nr:alanyl-tRNA editing protein Aarsd1-B-like isoform X2 [Homarus americanus]
MQPLQCSEFTSAACIYEMPGNPTIRYPDDRGTVEGIPVLRVQRRGGDAVHYLEKPLEVGAIVTQQIDWDRRHDHMQQHSAQHLITAVADAMYGYATNSWYLAESISYIELDTTKVSTAEINTIEETVNQRIKDATPVHIEEYDATDPKLREIRTRGLPDDVVGPVRVVTIEGVDANMCCGTHVRNLADLQAIKLLHTEKGKANKTLLYFVAGARVLRYLGECVSRERQFNILLHSCSSDHLRLVEKIQKDLKSSLKSLRDAMKDLAVFEGQKFLAQDPRPQVYFHHRRDGDMDYLSAIINEINDENVLKVLTVGEDKGPGSLVVHGPPSLVAEVGPRLCEILEGRGGGKSRFTGKVTKLGKRGEAEKYILGVMDNHKTES